MRLKDKKIVVTAAAQGIGRATALAFANEGAEVIATDINLDKLEDIKKNNTNIVTQKLDSTNKSEVEEFSKSIENIDILFHAVGFVHHGTIMDCDSDEFYRSINVNVYSAYLMSHYLLPKMLKKQKGIRKSLQQLMNEMRHSNERGTGSLKGIAEDMDEVIEELQKKRFTRKKIFVHRVRQDTIRQDTSIAKKQVDIRQDTLQLSKLLTSGKKKKKQQQQISLFIITIASRLKI